MLIVGGQPVSNINKKHPLETRVAFTLVKSHIEDVVYTLFHAERDEDSTSPSGAFDGLFTKADMLITTGDVNAARGNFAPSGIFALPTKKQTPQLMKTWLNGLVVPTLTCVPPSQEFHSCFVLKRY